MTDKSLNILQKLHLIQSEIEHMEKDGHNNFQNYSYLSETQVTLKMKQLFDLHKVMFVYNSQITDKLEISPTKAGTKQYVVDVRVDYKFVDVESGESVDGYACGQGSDVADKGVYKAITGAIKYIYMKTFNIPTGDDPERDAPRKSVQRTNTQSAASKPTYQANHAPTAMCAIHKVSMRQYEKNGKTWFSHKADDGSWCNGAPPKKVQTQPENHDYDGQFSPDDVSDDVPF